DVRRAVEDVARLRGVLSAVERPGPAAFDEVEELLVDVRVRRMVLGAGLDVGDADEHVGGGAGRSREVAPEAAPRSGVGDDGFAVGDDGGLEGGPLCASERVAGGDEQQGRRKVESE